MRAIIWAGAALAASLAFGTSAMSQGVEGNAPIIQKQTSGCPYFCTNVVNRDVTNRVVVTLQMVPTPSTFPMWDRLGNRVYFSQTTMPVLLQAGESRNLSDSLVYEMKSGQRQQLTIDYRIAGYYIPNPDLSDLPTGVAEDYARFYQQWDHDFDGSPACGTGHPEAKDLMAHNMNPYRSIAITFQNKRPGLNNEEQTIYLQPGREQTVGCVTDWPVLTVSAVRFAP